MPKPFIPQSVTSSQSPDLTGIAAMLYEAAQALLNFVKSSNDAAIGDGVDDESSDLIEEGYRRGEFH